LKSRSLKEGRAAGSFTVKGNLMRPLPLLAMLVFAAPALAQDANEINEIEAVAKGYSEADGWEKRLPFIMDAKNAEPLMREWYRENQAFTSGLKLKRLNVVPSIRAKDAFTVFLSLQRGGQDVTGHIVVRKVKDEFKVDWAGSVGHNPVPVKTVFATGRAPVKVRVSAEISDYYNYEYDRSRQSHLSVTYGDETLGFVHGYIPKDSGDGKALADLLKNGKSHRVILEIDFVGPFGRPIRMDGKLSTIRRFVSDCWVDPDPSEEERLQLENERKIKEFQAQLAKQAAREQELALQQKKRDDAEAEAKKMQEEAKAKEAKRQEEEAKAKPGRDAARKLVLAKDQLKQGQREVMDGNDEVGQRTISFAIRRFREIVATYPQTEAAIEAKQILKRLSK